MDFEELITRRYSARAYRSDLVEEEKLLKVLEAARLAPTAANCQPFQLIVVRTIGKEAELRAIYHREWLTQAPLVIFACGDHRQGWVRKDGKPYLDVDVAIAMDHLTLASANLGLGTCWIAAFNAEAAKSFLGLPPEIEPIIVTPLGYPADEPAQKERKALADLVRYEHW
jgi:nitroreductase